MVKHTGCGVIQMVWKNGNIAPLLLVKKKIMIGTTTMMTMIGTIMMMTMIGTTTIMTMIGTTTIGITMTMTTGIIMIGTIMMTTTTTVIITAMKKLDYLVVYSFLSSF